MMGARTIHELRAVITASMEGFESKLNAGARATEGLARSWVQAGKDINSALNRIGLATAGVLTGATVKFGHFELIMKRAGAVTQTLGTRDFDTLTDLARKMGEETVFSATQSAEAIEKMGLAGLNVREIMEALPGALQLASSAQISIAQAADISSKTMRAFGADAKELAHINDVLVGTFTRANTDITQLAEAMKHVAPVSKALGVSLEDTAALIAKLGDVGFQGSMAGTALRNIFSRLAGAMPEVTNKLKELGIESTTATGEMRPFLDIMEDIERQGLTDAQILEIFGARGGPQMLALLEVGTDAIRKFSIQLGEAGGLAQRVSDANLNSLWGAFKLVQSAAEAMAIDLGKALGPGLYEGAEELVGLIQTLRPDMEELGRTIAEAVTRNLIQFIKWLRESGPALMEAARGWSELLTPILDFLAAHPQLVAALLVLKGGEMFGVNQAVVSLSKAFLGLTTAIGGTTLAIPALVLALGVSLGTALAQTDKGIQEFNAELEKTIELQEQISGKQQDRRTRTLDEIRNMFSGPDKATAMEFARQQLEQARREAAGAEASVKGARSNLADARSKQTLLDMLGGDKVTAAFEQELKEAQARAHDATSFVKQLETEIGRLKLQVQQPEAPQAIRMPGVIAEGLSAEEKAAQVEAQKEAEKALKDAEEEAARRVETATNTLREFGYELFELQGQIPEEQLQRFADYIERLSANLESGAITEEEFERKLNAVTDAMRAATMAADAGASFDRLIENEMDRLAMEGIDSPAFGETANQLRAQLEQLARDFQAGAINTFQFRAETEKLTDALQQAAAAAREQEKQERREMMLRLLTGQGTQADWQKLQAMQQAAYMEQFWSGVEQSFNQTFLTFSNGVTAVNDQFGALTNSMQDFQSQLGGFFNGMGFGGQAPSFGQAWGAVTQMLNSLEGAIANTFNQIQLFKQSLQLVEDPQRRQEIMGEIARLERQYSALIAQRNQAPLFSGMNTETTPYQWGQQHNSFNLSFPNWSPQNAHDIKLLADNVAAELARRGYKAI